MRSIVILMSGEAKHCLKYVDMKERYELKILFQRSISKGRGNVIKYTFTSTHKSEILRSSY
jgi:hypothetical protein